MSIKKNLGYIEGWLSIILNVFLFVLKYWAGIITGSVALLADAWHTLSDSVSSVVVLLGVKVAEKEADEKHPFGHGQAEHIAAIVVSVLLAVISVNFMVESTTKLINKVSVNFGQIALIVTIISLLIKEAMAQFAFWAGRKTGSSLLRADAWHHRTDAISSLLILIGIFLGEYYWWIDGVLGNIVALFILYSAYEIFRDSSSPLLGTKIDDQLIKEIKDICEEHGIERFRAHHFHLHKYGNHIELTFHIKFPKNRTLDETHSLATLVEEQIRIKYGYEPTIHIEPEPEVIS